MQYLREYLDPKYSWWLADSRYLISLNEVPPTAENLRIIFYCEECDGAENLPYHVAKLEDIKIDQDGDYNFCCPEYDYDGSYQECVDCSELPEELKDIFESTSFEKVYDDVDEEDEE